MIDEYKHVFIIFNCLVSVLQERISLTTLVTL